MHQLASPGPDGSAGAMGGNSGADGRNEDPAYYEVVFGGRGSSPKNSGRPAIDRRNE